MSTGATGATGPTGPTGSTGPTGERLPLLFVGIVVVELLSIAGLYWLGAHFI